MNSTQALTHQNYDMLCGAMPDDSGRFQPTLVITKNVWPTRARTIAVERGVYDDQAHAIQAAHAQGLAWIANYG